jgi:hypothetical protein
VKGAAGFALGERVSVLTDLKHTPHWSSLG